jgi:hypothetical protein
MSAPAGANCVGDRQANLLADDSEIKFPRKTPITLKETNREASQGTGRVTRFQGENAL